MSRFCRLILRAVQPSRSENGNPRRGFFRTLLGGVQDVQLGVSFVLRGRRAVGPPPVTHMSALPPSAARFLDLNALGAAWSSGIGLVRRLGHAIDLNGLPSGPAM